MTLYHALTYYSVGMIGTLAWHQLVWRPPAYDEEWDEAFAGSGGMPPWELKENPKDRVVTDTVRSVFWPFMIPKMTMGSIIMFGDYIDKFDEKISKKLKNT